MSAQRRNKENQVSHSQPSRSTRSCTKNTEPAGNRNALGDRNSHATHQATGNRGRRVTKQMGTGGGRNDTLIAGEAAAVSDRIHELEERLKATEGQLQIAEECLANIPVNNTNTSNNGNQSTSQDTSHVPDSSVKRPTTVSNVKMSEIKRLADLDKPSWNNVRTGIRHTLHAGRLDWDKCWKAQKPDKLAKIFNAVDESFPVMRRFENQRGTERIAQEYWSGRKTYQNCITNPSTYRGRRHAARNSPSSGHSPSPPPDTTSTSKSSDGRRTHTPDNEHDSDPQQSNLDPLTEASSDESEQNDEDGEVRQVNKRAAPRRVFGGSGKRPRTE